MFKIGETVYFKRAGTGELISGRYIGDTFLCGTFRQCKIETKEGTQYKVSPVMLKSVNNTPNEGK